MSVLTVSVSLVPTPQLLTAKEVVYVVNMSSRDYLRPGRGCCQDIADRANEQLLQQQEQAATAVGATDDTAAGKSSSSVVSASSGNASGVHSTAAASTSSSSRGGGQAAAQHLVQSTIPVSLSFELKLLDLERLEGPAELAEYFLANPTHVSAMDTIIRSCYQALNLIKFYVCSEREVRCYLLRLGCTVVEAAALVDVKIAR